MRKELELWQFIAERLEHKQNVMLLVVAESSGSSPGRRGYKMAVVADGEMIGSIGGGVMEVNLVEQSRAILNRSAHESNGDKLPAELIDQVHRKNVPDSSGMICSGKQTVIFKLLRQGDIESVRNAALSIENHRGDVITLSPEVLSVVLSVKADSSDDFAFEKRSENDFIFSERLGPKDDLYIIGGGHCALALSEMMSKMDFHISLFDDRPGLNTIAKNKFADKIIILESYENIADSISAGANVYVVVMTLGYRSDEIVIRKLLEKDFKYFGVLGSKAKMVTLLQSLRSDGFSLDRLERLRTPVGLPINSHTPEEIAISIAAEIIAVKNAAD
ncbi:MAG TPA: XdhC family protein [Pyrinomonadaceae bacterium]|nr:XdhC family protein [Pyrinomonadaceae bacterium]